MNRLAVARRIHVIGVGGAGMSAVARLLAERGARVTGSDVADSPVTSDLRTLGVEVTVGHDPSLVDAADLVLASPAVPVDDPEWSRARALGLNMSRSELFGELPGLAPVIGLCGTHGKTTATSMMVCVEASAHRAVGWLVGAEVAGVGPNGHWGPEALVVEVDESYGTFAKIRPRALGVLNVDADHLDYYGSLGELEHAFAMLARRTEGPVVAWGADAGARRALRDETVTWVGTDDQSEWLVSEIEVEKGGSRFSLRGPTESARLALRVPGEHMVADAAVVAVLARSLGRGWEEIARGLDRFVGAPRRFTRHGAHDGRDLIEDYAHLPAELTATLATVRALGYRSPLVIFQPHRYTRTAALAEQFATCFDDAASVVVTDVYSAGEAPIEGVTGELIVRAITEHGGVAARYVAGLDDVVARFDELVDGHDVVLALGAGDVASIFDRVGRGAS